MTTKKISLIIACCTSLILAPSCTPPAQVTPELVDAYVDILILREMEQDTTRYQLRRDSLLTQKGFTRDNFADAITAMASNPALFKAFSDSVQSRLKTPVSQRR